MFIKKMVSKYQNPKKLNRYSPYILEKSTQNNTSQNGDDENIPCNQEENILNTKILIDVENQNLNASFDIFQSSANVSSQSTSSKIDNDVCHELSKSTISSIKNIFSESFNTSSNIECFQNKTEIEDETKLNTLDQCNESLLFQTTPERLDVLNNCGTTLCNFNETFDENSKNEKENHNKHTDKFFGLPVKAKLLVSQYKGIDKLYDWQTECLTLPAIENRKNLIYALPTSGGKTLVAEILMLKEIVCRRKNVLFVLPFVSIVQEKIWGLSPFAVNLNFLVEEYAGGKGVCPPRKRRNKNSIYIATIEKGFGLIRSLMETNRLSEIGLVVIDELHLLGEPKRGSTLEMLLTHIMYSGENIQVVGMSATIGNIEDLAMFLDAEVFTKDFRPVELKEYIKYGNNIMSINWNSNEEKIKQSRTVDYGYSSQVEKIDPDHLGGLVMEVIPDGSCLIFCPTKKNCESVAILLCKVIPKKVLDYRKQEKNDLIQLLKGEYLLKSLLVSLIPWGIAYHHSGLAFEERKFIEDAFRSGVLNVLCCTSTLAAGVNLPAQRVILRAPMVGKSFISLSTYKQMVGRAGRAGFGGHGDSILICPAHLANKVRTLISSPMDNVLSGLHRNDGCFMNSFVLGAIASETATNRSELRKLIGKSLLARQAERLEIDLKKQIDNSISTLFNMGALKVKHSPENIHRISNVVVSIDQTIKVENDSNESESPDKNNQTKKISISNHLKLSVSKLGKAAVKACIDMHRAQLLYSDLKEGQKGLVVSTVLHLLYLITPYDTCDMIKPDLSIYYSLFSNMDPDALQTSTILGFTESSVVKMATWKVPKNIPERVFNRFYATLILYDLWNQIPLQTVSEKFQLNRGTIQSLMEQGASFASCVLRFCEELEEFWAFKDLLSPFSVRLAHCCMTELLPLMELPNVKKNRAMQLYKAGYKTIKSIAQGNSSDMTESIDHLPLRTANQLIAAAKLLLLEKVENLREEAQDVMDELGVDL